MRFIRKAIILTLFSLLPTPVLAGPLGVPPDSFIRQHVGSVPLLARQVTIDPVVRRRLARHFQVSGPTMVRFVQDDLVLTRLRVASRFPVYCVTPGGREYVLTTRLPAGTPVFALRSTGRPILKLACGNPLVSELPAVQSFGKSARRAPEIAGSPLPAPTTVKAVLASNDPGGTTLVAAGQDVFPSLAAPVTPVVEVADFPAQLLRTSSSGGSPLGLLAGVPILYGILNGNGNGSSPNPVGAGTGTNPLPGTTGTGTPGTGTGSAAPEPSSYALFGFFAFGVASLVLRARKRRQN